MAKINWTPQARNDLVAIAEYIAQESPKYTKYRLKEFAGELSNFASFPNQEEKYQNIQEMISENLFRVIIGSFIN